MKKLLFVLILLISSLHSYSQVRQEWVLRKIISTGSSPQQYPLEALDSQGNLYVTGTLNTEADTNQTTDVFLVKYSPTGCQLWVRYYNGTGNGPDLAKDIYIDNYDFIFVLCDSYGGTVTNRDYCVIKYNSSGTVQWVSRYDTPEHFIDEPKGFTKDNSGNIFVTGVSNNSRFITIKLNYLGALQWVRGFASSLSALGSVIAIDNAGNVIVAGGFCPSENFWKAIFKYSNNGDSLWGLISGPAAMTGYVSAIKIDIANNIYIAGGIGNLSTYNTNYFVDKYSPAGALQWGNAYPPGSSSLADFGEIDLDGLANVYVTGGVSTNPPPERKCVTLKYNSSGTEQWIRNYYVGGGTYGSTGTALCFDKNGNLYITGKSVITSGMNYDYVTIKYNPSGDTLWSIRYEGTGAAEDIPSDIKVDGYGNVYVTGISKNPQGGYCAATIKYSEKNWDTTVAKWFPISTGNVWVYKHYTFNAPDPGYIYRGKVKYQIRKDTLMSNGKRYQDRTLFGFTRIDTAFMNVLQYSSTGEIKRDSLRAKLNDTLFRCLKVKDTANKTIFGSPRRNKFIDNICVITNIFYRWNVTYGIGYWTYAAMTDGTIEGTIDTLAGAVINGIVYGDTSVPVGIQPISGAVPDRYCLYQNYPNPFNPKSNIKFQIAKSGLVKLVVFDVLGREVNTLVNEQLRPGIYEVEWDGTNYPSGVYFYELATNDYTETKKMVLIR